jgi:hypothetical protein
MRRAVKGASIKELRTVYTFPAAKPEARDYLKDLGLAGTTI